MTSDRFEQLIDELETESLKTLKEKNRKYTAKSGDALHNFRTGASVDGTTMPQTIWHYWKKHFISLLDKIEEDNWEDKEDALEKIQDSINYLRFIWCAINDNEPVVVKEKNEEDIDCDKCVYWFIGMDDSNWDELGERVIVEPCASCKANICPLEKDEYEKAPNNFTRKLNIEREEDY